MYQSSHIRVVLASGRFAAKGLLLLGLAIGCGDSGQTPLGDPGLGGARSAGGTPGAGGTTTTGGATSGGSVGNGGQPAVGGVSSTGGAQARGGTSASGGASASGGNTGGSVASGGLSGGGTSTGGARTGGASSGATASGGNASGGTTRGGTAAASGGAPTGGVATSGGRATGGTASGGQASGGQAPGSGGQASGGQASGGQASGGQSSGGQATGGQATGGQATGGTAVGGSASGGTATGGTGGSDDRCNVGVYNASSPPSALTLSGSLGTHDPSALLANGTYYLFDTGLGSKTSTNVTNWTGGTAPFGIPQWIRDAVDRPADNAYVTNLWAPDISYFGGKYHLYYAGSTFGSNRSCIGHATRAAMNTGSWAESGGPVICSNVDTSDNWNAIDPAVVLDEAGTPWMVFGSFWSGIKLIQLDQNGNRVGTTVTSVANRPSNGGALEGPYIVRRCGYYYLFTSWDTCCQGANSTYNIRVGRSASVTGPYTDQAGTALLQGGGTLIARTGGSWVGPGGQAVFISGTNAYLVYHAYAASNGAATLRIADLVWDTNGWPMPVGP